MGGGLSTRSRLAAIALTTAGVALVAPLVGHTPIDFGAALAGSDEVAAVILWRIRVPRVLAALLGGAGLGVGGAVFQALFRNPLATPYTLGVAAGASFGIALGASLGLIGVFWGLSSTPLAALAGAAIAIATVWLLAELRPDFSSNVLLLAGVAMNFFFSSLILLLQYTATLGDSYRIVRWLMGGLAGVDGAAVAHLAPFVVLGLAAVALNARELDLLAMGRDVAASRGVDVVPVRRWLYAVTSVMVAGIVAACGPIGFVGMMAPHICRRLVGVEHRTLLPASALFGGAFLVVCDVVARTLLAPLELPVGVLTAFLGGPFFLWLLLGGRTATGRR